MGGRVAEMLSPPGKNTEDGMSELISKLHKIGLLCAETKVTVFTHKGARDICMEDFCVLSDCTYMGNMLTLWRAGGAGHGVRSDKRNSPCHGCACAGY